MVSGFQKTPRLKRRLLKWQIFFITIGGVIGVGFFQGASRTTGIAGPGGALMATIIVGLVAMAVMEAICHMICIWPIPNAMVEFVRAFVDEDLGTAIGVLYWYTYCVTFSVLINTIGTLSDYWGKNYMRRSVIYIVAPLVALAINAAPVEVFGWIEFVGGIVKLALVFGILLLMLLLNRGVNSDKIVIGTKFIDDSIQFDENVATNKFSAVAVCLPLAIFAYIGVELLTTTAFEARDPREMRGPARNIGWVTFVLYALTTGVFVSNVSWIDPNLPKLFNQALHVSMDPSPVAWPISDITSKEAHATPLIVLLRLGYRFLPAFVNGCLIYSALSCANTSLYVASRQLYGLTRTITVTSNSNFLRKFFGWMGRVEHRTKSPWPALFISVLVLYWLPFINRENNYSPMDDVQAVLSNAGSVACILVWCSQCIAYLFFYNWREKHRDRISSKTAFAALLDDDNTGWFYVFQPYMTYLAAFATIAIVVFFNTASLWHGPRPHVKALSAFGSPAILLVVYIIKKFTRRDRLKFWNNLQVWYDFETQIQYLNDLIFPDDPDAHSDHDSVSGQEMKPSDTIQHHHRSLSDVSTNFGVEHSDSNSSPAAHLTRPPWAVGDLQLIPHGPEQLNLAARDQPVNQTPTTPEARHGAISNQLSEEPIAMSDDVVDSPVDHRNPNSIGSSTKYYDGRNTLSPRDAMTYQQSPSPQTESNMTPFSDLGIAPISSSSTAHNHGGFSTRSNNPHSASYSNLRPYTHPHPFSQAHSPTPAPSRSLPQLHSQAQTQPQTYSSAEAHPPLSTADPASVSGASSDYHQRSNFSRTRFDDSWLAGPVDEGRQVSGKTPGPSFRERAMNSIPTAHAAVAAATASPASSSFSGAAMTTLIPVTERPRQVSIPRRPVPNREFSGTSSVSTPPNRFASPTSSNTQSRIPPLHSPPPQETEPTTPLQSGQTATESQQHPLPESLRIGNRNRVPSWGWGEHASGVRQGSGGIPGRHEFG